MPPVGFEHTISAIERPQAHALERAATETGSKFDYSVLSPFFPWSTSLLLYFILFETYPQSAISYHNVFISPVK